MWGGKGEVHLELVGSRPAPGRPESPHSPGLPGLGTLTLPPRSRPGPRAGWSSARLLRSSRPRPARRGGPVSACAPGGTSLPGPPPDTRGSRPAPPAHHLELASRCPPCGACRRGPRSRAGKGRGCCEWVGAENRACSWRTR